MLIFQGVSSFSNASPNFVPSKVFVRRFVRFAASLHRFHSQQSRIEINRNTTEIASMGPWLRCIPAEQVPHHCYNRHGGQIKIDLKTLLTKWFNVQHLPTSLRSYSILDWHAIDVAAIRVLLFTSGSKVERVPPQN